MSEPLKLIPAEPVGEDVMRRISEAMEAAGRGEISSIAIAYVDREGVITSGWSTPPSMGLLVGAVSSLLYKMNRNWLS